MCCRTTNLGCIAGLMVKVLLEHMTSMSVGRATIMVCLRVGEGMGRGDSRTRRGKTFKGSYGNSRAHAPKTQKTGTKQTTKK